MERGLSVTGDCQCSYTGIEKTNPTKVLGSCHSVIIIGNIAQPKDQVPIWCALYPVALGVKHSGCDDCYKQQIYSA